MDLFDYMREKTQEQESPLASRMRPQTLEEVVGQQHIIGKDKLLYRAIKADKLGSIIFYGPPGTGKTTLAKVIAHTTSAEFKQINATVAGKKDMEQVVNEAKELLGMYRKKTILFIDEIHRFNKGQQDYLLPFVEDGTITLIGATTENPYFEVNGALISRSSVFELKSLEKEDIRTLLKRAVYDENKGMGSFHAEIEEDALEFLADVSGGDARSALNAIELGVLTTERSEDGKIHIRWMWRQNVFKSGLCAMIRAETIIMIRFPHLSKVCGDLIPMLQCIIWQKCCMQEKISNLLPAGS